MGLKKIFLNGLMAVLSLFFLTGCFNVASSTQISISDIDDSEYIKIKHDLKYYAENILKFKCEFDGTLDGGQLVCHKKNFSELYVTNRQDYGGFPKENEKYYDVFISYGEVPVFIIPYHGRITSEHVMMQKILLKIASNLKKKYKSVKVIFGHHSFDKPHILEIPN